MHMVNACNLARPVSLGQMTAMIGAHAPLVGGSSFAMRPEVFGFAGLENAVTTSKGRKALFAGRATLGRQSSPKSSGQTFESRLSKAIQSRIKKSQDKDRQEHVTVEFFTRVLTLPPDALLRQVLRIDPEIKESIARDRHWLAQAQKLFKEVIGNLKEDHIPESIRDFVDTLLLFPDWNRAKPDLSVIRTLEEYLEGELAKWLNECWAAYGDWLLANEGGGVNQGRERGLLIQLDHVRQIGSGSDKSERARQEGSRRQLENRLESNLIEKLGIGADQIECEWERGYLKSVAFIEVSADALQELFEREDVRFLLSLSIMRLESNDLSELLDIEKIFELEEFKVDGCKLGSEWVRHFRTMLS